MYQQPTRIQFWDTPTFARLVPHCSRKTIIAGHTPQKDGFVFYRGFFKCIDTFCHGGQWLTALEVDTGRYWQANQRGEIRRGKERGYSAAM